jgi:hypothetical protein
MDTETEEKTEFKFDELGPEAQAKALQDWAVDGMQYEWWDSTYEDVITIGNLIGIEIDTKNRGLDRGINFSGFWSQGDGCCFSGTLHIEKMKNAVEQVLTHVGEEDKVLAIAKQAEALWQTIMLRLLEVRRTGQDMEQELQLEDSIVIQSSSRSFHTCVSNDLETTRNIVKDINSFLEDFASYIYNQLEAEHDYLTSEDSAKECFEANEYLFDESGSML